jgi:predicted permease
MTVLFLMIAIGFLLGKIRFLPKETPSILAKLENAVFVPCLILGTFIPKFTVQQLGAAWKLLLFGAAIAAVTIPIAILLARLLTKDTYRRNVFTYGLAFSNFGFMGNAVVSALFPDLFWKYLLFTFPFWILLYVWGVPSLLISGGEGRLGVKERLKNFFNPMCVALLLGMVLGLLNVTLPGSVMRVIDTLGGCMSPMAMLLTGVTISQIKFREVFSDLSIYTVTAVRLLAIPAVFLACFSFLPIPSEFMIYAICFVSMPLGLNVIVIPAAYGRDTSSASGMVLVSHALSCLTIPIVFSVLNLLL